MLPDLGAFRGKAGCAGGAASPPRRRSQHRSQRSNPWGVPAPPTRPGSCRREACPPGIARRAGRLQHRPRRRTQALTEKRETPSNFPIWSLVLKCMNICERPTRIKLKEAERAKLNLPSQIANVCGAQWSAVVLVISVVDWAETCRSACRRGTGKKEERACFYYDVLL